ASAGSRAARAAAPALMRAFSPNVIPFSSGSTKFSSPADLTVMPYGASSSRISASLPGLCVAITKLSAVRGRLSDVRWLSEPFGALALTIRPPTSDLCRPTSQHRHLLQIDQLSDALARQRQQSAELRFGERNFLRGGLHLDDIAGTGEDEIGVGVSL